MRFAGFGLALAVPAAALINQQVKVALDSCLSTSGVPTEVTNSSSWKVDATVFNLRMPYQPMTLVAPTTAEEVQAAVQCGAQAGAKVTAKCGGHSYANFGFGGEDGHLVIEMDRMYNVTLDNTTGIAAVQGGTRLGHLATQLYTLGNKAISHGTCPGVGVGGHVLHGGYGMSSRMHGLALDWLVGARMVLANSTIVNVSATENPDLFWAIKGAGSAMGVVTDFYFKTFDVPDVLTVFMSRLSWNNATTAAAGFKIVQDWAESEQPAEVNARLYITNTGVSFEGLYYGNKTALQAALAPLLTKLNAKLLLQQQGGWLDQLNYFGMGIPLDQTTSYNQHSNFYSTSLYTDKLNDDQLTNFTNYWFTVANAKTLKRDWYLQIDLHGGASSAVSKAAADSSSYAHRSRLLLYQFYDSVDNTATYPASGFSFFDGWVANLTLGDMGSSQYGMYFNYPDPNMDQTLAQQMYWADSLSKLQTIKAAIDPDQVFYLPQGVVPVAASGPAPASPGSGGADGCDA